MDDKPYLLHMFTPAKLVSPFDVNMAYDAGWTAVVPYPGVGEQDVAAMVQDAIFSRGPKGVRRTGIFIGGRDAHLAMDMLETAKKAMVPPFEVSVMSDPSGAFTTAAALVACAERQLGKAHGATLDGAAVAVFGGTGPVGLVAALLVAKAGGRARIVSSSSLARARQAAELCAARHGVTLGTALARTAQERGALLADVDVVLAAAKAGVQLLSAAQVRAAPRLKVAADVNAVPPAGIAGVGAQDDGVALAGSPSGAVGIGALAVGNVKYKVEQDLLARMRSADGPLYLGYEQAFERAREHVR